MMRGEKKSLLRTLCLALTFPGLAQIYLKQLKRVYIYFIISIPISVVVIYYFIDMWDQFLKIPVDPENIDILYLKKQVKEIILNGHFVNSLYLLILVYCINVIDSLISVRKINSLKVNITLNKIYNK